MKLLGLGVEFSQDGDHAGTLISNFQSTEL